MATNARDVEIPIVGVDKTARATRSAGKNFDDLRGKVRKTNEEIDGGRNAVTRFASRINSVVGKVKGKFTSIFDGIDAKAKAAVGLSLKVMRAAIAAGAPALGAAIVAGMALGVGGGIIAIGAYALRENERIKKAFTRTSTTIGKVLTKAAQPLVGPFVAALRQAERITKKLAPDFRAIFRAIAPVVRLLSDAFGGVLVEVVRALRDSMPGVTAAFRGLASALPTVGKWIGQFIRTLLSNPKVIENTTRALTLLAAGPLKLLGPLLSGLNVIFGAQVNLFRLLEIGGGSLFAKLVGWFDSGSGAVDRLKAAWGPLGTAIQDVWDKLKAFAGAKTDKEIATKFHELVESLKRTWGPLKTFIGTVWAEAWAFLKRVWNEQVVPWWNGTAKPWLKSQVSGAMDAIFKMAVDKAVAQLKKLPGRAIAALAGLPGALVGALAGRMASAGSSIGRGFVDAIVRAINAGTARVRNAGRGLGDAGAAAAKAAAGQFSAGVGSWAPAATAAQFAGGQTFATTGAGTHRTGGPVQVEQTLNVSLDGEPFHHLVATAISGNNRRQAWLNRNGRR